MARARLLKPGFFQNERLAELPFEGRLLFAGLWTLADREGRLEDRPRRIKAALFPWDDVAIDDLLAGLAERDFITRYQVETVAVIQITKFLEHQKPHKHEQQSKLPESTDLGRADDGSRPAVSKTVSKTEAKNVSGEPGAPASPPVAVFPCMGAVKDWPLAVEQVQTWQEQYPTVDVPAEVRKAVAWVQANPGHRKTASGMPRFLVNWLNRATNDRRFSAGRRVEDKPRLEPVHHEPFRCPHTPECGTAGFRSGRAACWQRTQLEAMKAEERRLA